MCGLGYCPSGQECAFVSGGEGRRDRFLEEVVGGSTAKKEIASDATTATGASGQQDRFLEENDCTQCDVFDNGLDNRCYVEIGTGVNQAGCPPTKPYLCSETTSKGSNCAVESRGGYCGLSNRAENCMYDTGTGALCSPMSDTCKKDNIFLAVDCNNFMDAPFNCPAAPPVS